MSESSMQKARSSGPTPDAAWGRWRTRCEALLVVLALTPIVLFLVTSLRRLRYPFPLEQLEGSMLLAAERVAHGLPIYIQPNFHFIPYMYAPAYYYVSGWAVRALGPGFVALRLVSLLSTCASFVLLYFLVFRETDGVRKRRHLAALAGVGLYAAAYPWTREWFDLGRLDALYIFLLLVALLCTRLSQQRLHPVFAAAAWTLVFLTKQTIFPVALVMLCCNWKRPQRVVFGVLGFLVLTAASIAVLNHATQGWFWFYTFSVPGANADLLLRPAVFYIPARLLAPFGIAFLVIGVGWAQMHTGRSGPEQPGLQFDSARVEGKRSEEKRLEGVRFYLLALISTFCLCWFLQAHGGATANTAMPVYAVLAIAFGIFFGRIDAALARDGCREPARIFLLTAVGIPLIAWVYNPHDSIPHRDLVASNQKLVQWLRGFPGEVFLPAAPYEAVLAGKHAHPDMAGLHDALRAASPRVRQALLEEIRSAIDGEKFDAIVLDGLPTQVSAEQPWLPRDLENHYPVLGRVPGSDVGNPFTPHPAYFLLPCREQARAMAAGWTLLEPGGKSACPH